MVLASVKNIYVQTAFRPITAAILSATSDPDPKRLKPFVQFVKKNYQYQIEIPTKSYLS